MSKLSTAKSTQSKETIYVDVDDEITTIIDRVSESQSKIVALVLPKRAAVMQSVVNMRLLKRTSDNAGKHLVLVTNEAGLLPLAGLVGLHVAETSTSKPAIPAAPKSPEDGTDKLEEEEGITVEDEEAKEGDKDNFDQKAAATVPVGVLAAKKGSDKESIILNDANLEKPAAAAVSSAGAAATETAPKKIDKKLKVPSFNKFKIGIALTVLGVLLLVGGWLLANNVLPKAVVAITTDSSTVETNLDLILDTSAKEADLKERLLPAVAATENKSLSADVPATGQQNKGEKASGKVRLAASVCAPNLGSDPSDVEAGSALTSGGRTYILQEKAEFSFARASGNCMNYTSDSVSIVALRSGAESNTGSGASFSGPQGTTGTGSASGGTDEIVKIVTQADIDAAKAKIEGQDVAAVKKDLQAKLKGQNLQAVVSTFVSGEQQVTSSAKVGDEAEAVKVSAVVPYTMLGIHQKDLRELVIENVKTKIDENKQQIIDDGVDKAVFSQEDPGTPTGAEVAVRVKSVAGPDLNASEIKKQISGKKQNDVETAIKSTPGVTEVTVDYSPFWVTRVPDNPEKVTVTIDGAVKS